MKKYFKDLDKAFENRVRLQIMSVLMIHDKYEFVQMKDLIGLTDGNLATHLKKLEASGYIEVIKGYKGRKPQTLYSATTLGKKSFNKHLKAMEEIVKMNQ